MTDPRTEHKWKQTRHEQRMELLLGAILDALRKDVPRKAAKDQASQAKAEKA